MRFALLMPLVLAQSALAQGPRYANEAARAVVDRMVEAHGGLERWRALTTLRYDNVFFNPGAPDGSNPWWIMRETFNLPERLTYHDWPLDGARMAFDGQRVWASEWKQGNYPRFMSFFFFHFLNLPWLTQEPGTVIGPAGGAELPGLAGAFDTVRVRWPEPVFPGRSPNDFFLLYVERETGLLRAYRYGIGYGAMLDLMKVPPERSFFGPVLRFHDDFVTVDGLVFPQRMHTRNLEATRVYGYHAIVNYSTADPWDPARLTMPAGAVIDTSRATRREPPGRP